MNFLPRRQGFRPFVLSGGLAEDACQEYARDYMAVCRRVKHGVTLDVLGIQYDYMHTDEATMDRDPVYDWLGKQGLRYSVATILVRSPDHDVDISLQRATKAGHVQRPEIEQFQRVIPHIRQALTISRHLDIVGRRERFSLAVLEKIAKPAFAMAPDGRILFANRGADRILSAGLDIVSRNGRLRFPADHSAARRLDARLSDIASQRVVCDSWVRIGKSDGTALGLQLMPLMGEAVRDAMAEATVLAVIHDPAVDAGVPVEALSEIFGLTRTEAAVAAAIVKGQSVGEAAMSLGQSYETTRTHIKRIFAKMGISRQQDLVRICASLA